MLAGPTIQAFNGCLSFSRSAGLPPFARLVEERLFLFLGTRGEHYFLRLTSALGLMPDYGCPLRTVALNHLSDLCPIMAFSSVRFQRRRPKPTLRLPRLRDPLEQNLENYEGASKASLPVGESMPAISRRCG